MLCYAKSLQSCPTLCDPIDSSQPGSPVPGILQARTLEWAAISFSNAWKWKVKVKSLSHIRLLATPWTATHQAPPSMGFSRQEYWSGVPLPSPNRSIYSLKTVHKVCTVHVNIDVCFSRWRGDQAEVLSIYSTIRTRDRVEPVWETMGSTERAVCELYSHEGHVSGCVEGTGPGIELKVSCPHPTPTKEDMKCLWQLGMRRVIPNTAWNICVSHSVMSSSLRPHGL